MAKRSFTLMEIIIVIVVVGILATLGIPAYQSVIEDSKAKACQTNLEALQTALDIYAMENDNMPGDLSELVPGYLEKAYAQILQRKGAWEIKLAYFVVGWQQRGLAYAELLQDLSHGNISLLSCPNDSTPPAAGGVSYAINELVASLTSEQYRNLAAGTYLIGDCDTTILNANGSNLSSRHVRPKALGREHYAQAVNTEGSICKIAVEVVPSPLVQAPSPPRPPEAPAPGAVPPRQTATANCTPRPTNRLAALIFDALCRLRIVRDCC